MIGVVNFPEILLSGNPQKNVHKTVQESNTVIFLEKLFG